MLTEELRPAVSARGPGQRGNGVDDQREISFARSDRLTGTLYIVDVHEHHVPARDLPALVSHRQRAHLEPAIDSVRPAAPMLHAVWLPRGDRLGEGSEH